MHRIVAPLDTKHLRLLVRIAARGIKLVGEAFEQLATGCERSERSQQCAMTYRRRVDGSTSVVVRHSRGGHTRTDVLSSRKCPCVHHETSKRIE